ncbi:MAG: hypothetical protein ACT4O1_11670 [Gemmatimonadota bacterium]
MHARTEAGDDAQGLQPPAAISALGRSELLDEIGEENIFGNIENALVRHAIT